MRLCRHVITNDTGLAPNPFHGYCTSALCTPSHMKAKLQKGDWLIGNSPKNDGNRLVYAMRISEVLCMNTYFHDGRFELKKPKPDGTPEEQCGDNIYYRHGDGQWRRIPSHFHNEGAKFIQDVGMNKTGRPVPVFVSEHFYYFGDRRVAIPRELAQVIKDRQGTSWTTGSMADDFVSWLEANHKPGVLGIPRDMKDRSGEMKPMITRITDDARLAKSQERPERQPTSQSPSDTPSRTRGCR